MDTRERHNKENEPHRHDDDGRSDVIADGLRAEGKNRKRNGTKKVNRLWLWLGVLVLVLILLYWIFVPVMGWDLLGGANG